MFIPISVFSKVHVKLELYSYFPFDNFPFLTSRYLRSSTLFTDILTLTL